MNQNLKDALSLYTVPLLKVIARLHHITISNNTKKDPLINELCSKLLNKNDILQIISHLDKKEKELLRYIVSLKGLIKKSDIKSEYGTINFLKSFYLDYASPWENASSPIEKLYYCGLITSVKASEYIYIPEDLLRLLSSLIEYLVKEPTEKIAEEEPEEIISEENYTATNEKYEKPVKYTSRPGNILDDSFNFLVYVEKNPLTLLKNNGTIRKKDLRELSSILSICKENIYSNEDSSFEYIYFLNSLCYHLELIKNVKNRLSVTDNFSDWLKIPSDQQFLNIYHTWLETFSIFDESEFSELNFIAGNEINYNILEKALNFVKNITSKKGVFVDFFQNHFPLSEKDLIQEDFQEYDWYSNAHLKNLIHSLFTPKNKAILIETKKNIFTKAFLKNLYWMNFAEVGKNDLNQGISFKLTKIGKKFLRVGSETDDSEEESNSISINSTLLVQPNFEIIVSNEADYKLLYELEAFCQLKSSEQYKIYSLTRESIQLGLQKGLTHEDILTFLTANCSKSIPQNVKFTIEEWSNEFGNIRILSGNFLMTQNEILMKEMKSIKSLSGCISKPVTPNICRLEINDTEDLKKKLLKKGYLPSVVSSRIHMKDELSLFEISHIIKALELYSEILEFNETDNSAVFRILKKINKTNDIPQQLLTRFEQSSLNIFEEFFENVSLSIKDSKKHFFKSPEQELLKDSKEENFWENKDEVALSMEEKLDIIHKGIKNNITLKVAYYSLSFSEISFRIIGPPYELLQSANCFYLKAFCFIGNCERVFRIDRIKTVEFDKN